MVDIMPTKDETEKWEEALESPEGTLKFPVFLFSVDELSLFVEIEEKITLPTIRLKSSESSEVVLKDRKKKRPSKGNELF